MAIPTTHDPYTLHFGYYYNRIKAVSKDKMLYL